MENEVHNNSSVEIYYQVSKKEKLLVCLISFKKLTKWMIIESFFSSQCDLQATKSSILLELFCQIISEPCFNTLRTQEQLGLFKSRHW